MLTRSYKSIKKIKNQEGLAKRKKCEITYHIN
jgi:hypothetical protein